PSTAIGDANSEIPASPRNGSAGGGRHRTPSLPVALAGRGAAGSPAAAGGEPGEPLHPGAPVRTGDPRGPGSQGGVPGSGAEAGRCGDGSGRLAEDGRRFGEGHSPDGDSAGFPGADPAGAGGGDPGLSPGDADLGSHRHPPLRVADRSDEGSLVSSTRFAAGSV